MVFEKLAKLSEAALYKHGTSNGLILCFDMKNFVSGHMLRNNLRSMKKFFAFVQEGMAIKIHAIHIFNTAKIFHLVMAVIKPFMSADLVARVRNIRFYDACQKTKLTENIIILYSRIF